MYKDYQVKMKVSTYGSSHYSLVVLWKIWDVHLSHNQCMI